MTSAQKAEEEAKIDLRANSAPCLRSSDPASHTEPDLRARFRLLRFRALGDTEADPLALLDSAWRVGTQKAIDRPSR
jgi:hypothetical protein